MSGIVEEFISPDHVPAPNDAGYEPMLHDTRRRFVLFPLQYHDIWEQYTNLLSTFWQANEIDLEEDAVCFREKLTEGEQHYLKTILGFFASADAIVNLNLLGNFSQEVVVPEALCFLSFQAAQENVHSETYSLLIDRLIQSNEEKTRLFHALETMPSIQRKGAWALSWCDPQKTDFATRVVAFACVEGLLFAASFAGIAWMKHRGLMPGLGCANEYISRDESLHCQFACLVYRKYIRNKLTVERVHEIVREAVEIEDEFVSHGLPVRLVGMDPDEMKVYVRWCANRLLRDLGVPELYENVENPWTWINLLSLQGLTSFFEKRNTDYAKSNVTRSSLTFEGELF